MNGHSMASCVRNILIKYYQNLIIGFQVTVENVGDAFLRQSVHCSLHSSPRTPIQNSRRHATTDTSKATSGAGYNILVGPVWGKIF